MRVVVGTFVATVVAGCGTNAVGTEPHVDCITVGPSVKPSSLVLHQGDTARFTLDVPPTCAMLSQPSNQTALAFWSSSDTLVALVNVNDGLVRAVSNGRVTITGADRRDPSVKSAAVVTVVP